MTAAWNIHSNCRQCRLRLYNIFAICFSTLLRFVGSGACHFYNPALDFGIIPRVQRHVIIIAASQHVFWILSWCHSMSGFGPFLTHGAFTRAMRPSLFSILASMERDCEGNGKRRVSWNEGTRQDVNEGIREWKHRASGTRQLEIMSGVMIYWH